MSDIQTVRLTVRAFEFGAKAVANVLMRIVDTKNVVGVYRCNPMTADLPPGNYGIYISGDNYDTAFRAVNLLSGCDMKLDLPVYSVGTMPPPPANIRDMPVCRDGVDAKGLPQLLGVSVERAKIKQETYDGPVFVDYRNPDGFVFTTKLKVENEPVITTMIGVVPVQIMADCGNNTWREMGSPGKQ